MSVLGPGFGVQSRSRGHVKADLERLWRWAVQSRFFDNDPNKVPRMALTVGVATVLEAREIGKRLTLDSTVDSEPLTLRTLQY